jgi:hypothetical protein
VNDGKSFFSSTRPLLALLAAFAHAGLRPKTVLASKSDNLKDRSGAQFGLCWWKLEWKTLKGP